MQKKIAISFKLLELIKITDKNPKIWKEQNMWLHKYLRSKYYHKYAFKKIYWNNQKNIEFDSYNN